MDTKKKGVGRDKATTLPERQGIALLKATGASNREIARKTGRSRQTVASVLASPDVERLRAQARAALDTHLPQFATDLMKASKVGALRGRHEPAFDALLSLAVLEKPHSETVPRVIVNIGLAPGASGLALEDAKWLPDPRRPTIRVDAEVEPRRRLPAPNPETDSTRRE